MGVGGVKAGSELRRVFQLRLLFLPVSSHTVFKIRKPVSSGPEEQREAHRSRPLTPDLPRRGAADKASATH